MAKTITYDITDKDVYKSAVSSAEAMHKIRTESLANKSPVSEQEYSALAKRLAACIKSMRHLAGSAETLDTELEKNPDLYHYDPLQMNYWKGRPESADFMRGIAEFARAVLDPPDFVEFYSKDMEYHVFQALKQLEGKESRPVTQLPADKIFESVDVSSNSLEALVEAYGNAGYMSMRMKAKEPGKSADRLRKKGYEVMPNGDSVTVTFKASKDMNQFFETVMGYSKVKAFQDGYYAKAKDGYIILDKKGNIVELNGVSKFKGIAQKGDALEVKGDSEWAYFSGGRMLFYGKWFGKQLNDNYRNMLDEMGKDLGKEITGWALQMPVDIDYAYALDREAMKKVHNLGVKPSETLVKRIGSMEKDVKDISDFVKAYEAISAVELDGASLWQMLDKMNDDETDAYIGVMAECYRKKGKDTKAMTEAYQERRTEHTSHESLMKSVVDFLLFMGKM